MELCHRREDVASVSNGLITQRFDKIHCGQVSVMALFARQPTAAELLATDDARIAIFDVLGKAVASDTVLTDTIRQRAVEIATQQWNDFKTSLDTEVAKAAAFLVHGLADTVKHAIGTLERAATATIDARITNSDAIRGAVTATIDTIIKQPATHSRIESIVQDIVGHHITRKRDEILSDFLSKMSDLKPDFSKLDAEVNDLVTRQVAALAPPIIEAAIIVRLKSAEIVAEALHGHVLDQFRAPGSKLALIAAAEIRNAAREIAASEIGGVIVDTIRGSAVVPNAAMAEISRQFGSHESELAIALRTAASEYITENAEAIFPVYRPLPALGGGTEVIRSHFQQDDVRRALSVGNVMMVGPAGSGKTSIAYNIAREAGLQFYMNGAIQSEYKLLGFQDANGIYRSTPFYVAFTSGGLYLFDEIDASSAGTLVAFNTALANGKCDFPGHTEPVQMHPDFRCIAAANTFGLGASRVYVGRNQLDAATLDRFIIIGIDYDTALEMANAPNNGAWVKQVQSWRIAMRDQKDIRHVISSRACSMGARLLQAGFDQAAVEEMIVWKGLDAGTVERIRNAAR
jgi:hypothetical protein